MAALDLGMVLFKRAADDPKYYAGTMDAFLKARSPFDAACVAEQYMTLDELVGYASTLAPTDEDKNAYYPTRLPDIRHLCARRLAREDSLEKAIPFYPEAMQDEARTLFSNLRNGRDPAKTRKERAESLIDAARVTREDGMELYGTALAPDGRSYDGQWGEQDGKPWPKGNQPKPNTRFHYRYLAADLMWEAAQLLPDNDPLTATALYEGGTFLKNRDPKAADRFYKALVRRNPNLAVAQQANKLRWFPPDFDDRVVYAQHSHFALTPRKVKALSAAGLAMLLPAIIISVMRKTKKAAKREKA